MRPFNLNTPLKNLNRSELKKVCKSSFLFFSDYRNLIVDISAAFNFETSLRTSEFDERTIFSEETSFLYGGIIRCAYS